MMVSKSMLLQFIVSEETCIHQKQCWQNTSSSTWDLMTLNRLGSEPRSITFGLGSSFTDICQLFIFTVVGSSLNSSAKSYAYCPVPHSNEQSLSPCSGLKNQWWKQSPSYQSDANSEVPFIGTGLLPEILGPWQISDVLYSGPVICFQI